MDQARSEHPMDLDRRISGGRHVGAARRKLWDSCRGPEGAEGLSASPGELLQRFRFLELDSLTYDSLDRDKAIKWCGNVLVQSDDRRKLWDSLLAEIQTVRTDGGYISKYRLVKRLGMDYVFRPEGGSNLTESLTSLPIICRDRIKELEQWSPSVARQLVALLSGSSARTPGTLARLAQHPPNWLEKADSLAWDTISEFVDTHDLPGLDALQEVAIRKGSTRSSIYLIDQAVRAAMQGDRARAKELLSQMPPDYPLLTAAKARIEGHAKTVVELVVGEDLHNAEDPDLALNSVAMLVWAYWELEWFRRLTSMLRAANKRFPGRGWLLFHQANSTLAIVDQVGVEATGSHDLMSSVVELALASRDCFRLWGGPSHLAVGVATKTLLFLDDPWRVIDLASQEPDGEARASEANDPTVLKNLARAYLILGRIEKTDALLLKGIEQTEAELIRGLRSIEGDPSALPRLRETLVHSDDKNFRRQALWALAHGGEANEEYLKDFSDDEAALFRGVAALRRKEMAEAINHLKPHELASRFNAHYLAQAQFESGEPDEAVATLENAARHFGDPTLCEPAVRFLENQGKYEEARALIADVLAKCPFRAVRFRLRAALVRIANSLEDWHAMETYAQALVEEFPQDRQAPWMVVYAMHRQGKNQQAWTYLDGNDLIPPTKDMARVAIVVCRTADGPEHDAERLLRISELYADSEEVAGSALMTLATRSDLFNLTKDQEARLQHRAEDFFARFPQSRIFGRYSADTPEELFEMMTTSLRSRSEQIDEALDDVFNRIRYGILPHGVLVKLSNRPYTDILLSSEDDWLTAIPVDEDRRAREREAARKALNGTISADTSVAIFGLATGLDTARLGGAFKTVLVADELVFDARVAGAAAKEPVKAVVSYDRVLGKPTLTEVNADRRKAGVQKAESVLKVLEGWRRVGTGHLPPPSHLGAEERLPPWDASLRLAATGGLSLWCDDLGLRSLAELEGIPTFGTWALLEALTSTPGFAWLPALPEMKLRLLKARICDVPVSLQELEQLTADSDDIDMAVCYFLSRPHIWSLDALDAFRWYLGRVRTITEGPDRQQIPVLLLHASHGWAAAVPPSDQAGVLSQMLATTVLTVMDSTITPTLLAAIRYATEGLGGSTQPDPLPHAIGEMLNILEDTVGPARGAQMLTLVFAEANPDDRQTVMSIILGER